MGTIVQRRITRAIGGKDRGQLDVETDWVMPDGQPILREATTFVFQADRNLCAVDRITTLTALDKRVVFHDDKEGLIGLRMRISPSLSSWKTTRLRSEEHTSELQSHF